MFEAVELGRSTSAASYHAAVPQLRAALLAAHFALSREPYPVVVIVAGPEASGKGELVQRFNEWLDPRGVQTHAFLDGTEEQREHPPYWRFWRALPARGRVGIFFGSWYTDPILRRAFGRMKPGRFDATLDRITAFEQMLADDGTLLVKLWLHVPKRELKRRLEREEKDGIIAPHAWSHCRHYDRFVAVAERAVRRTDTAGAPWHVIEATDRRYRDLTAGNILLDVLRSRPPRKSRPRPAPRPAPRTAPVQTSSERDSVLAHVDLTARLSHGEYRRRRDDLQARLGQLVWRAQRKKVSTVLLFEGWDAAGKGSAIRRVTQAMDPRLYHVVGVSAPTDEEQAHHYLWRFWRQLPRSGFVTIFDRSWYGRVLVERVEGFARPDEWGRAYHEINDFEEQLTDAGVVLLKFWLHISPEEQLRRFRRRQRVAYKRYKITPDDWRNRSRWPEYRQAVDDMVMKCSTEYAPWVLVAANDKRFARIQVLSTLVDRLEAAP